MAHEIGLKFLIMLEDVLLFNVETGGFMCSIISGVIGLGLGKNTCAFFMVFVFLVEMIVPKLPDYYLEEIIWMFECELDFWSNYKLRFLFI